VRDLGRAGHLRDRIVVAGALSTARSDRGYGRSDGSSFVGVGGSVSGVVIKLHAAARVEGRVVISSTKQPCEVPDVTLIDHGKPLAFVRVAAQRQRDGDVVGLMGDSQLSDESGTVVLRLANEAKTRCPPR
jgi:hypothetical protein